MAATYYSGSAALPLQVHGRMLGGFQTDANGAYASLPVQGQAGAGGTPDATDVTAGDALSSEFASASGSILMALNHAVEAGSYSAGQGIDAAELAGNTIQLEVDGTTLALGAGGVKVDDSGITVTQLANDAVETAKIKDANVTNAKLQNSSISFAGDVDAADGILGGAATLTISDNAVTTAKILDANVTLAKIEDAAANTVLVRDANSSGVLSAKAVADTQLLIGDGTGFTAASLSGDVTMLNTGAVAIGATKVTSAMLNADVFTTSHEWTTGAQKFDTNILQIKGSDQDGNANRAYGFKVDGGVLVLTEIGAF